MFRWPSRAVPMWMGSPLLTRRWRTAALSFRAGQSSVPAHRPPRRDSPALLRHSARAPASRRRFRLVVPRLLVLLVLLVRRGAEDLVLANSLTRPTRHARDR